MDIITAHNITTRLPLREEPPLPPEPRQLKLSLGLDRGGQTEPTEREILLRSAAEWVRLGWSKTEYLATSRPGVQGQLALDQVLQGIGKNVVRRPGASSITPAPAMFRDLLRDVRQAVDVTVSPNGEWRCVMVAVPHGWEAFTGLISFNDAMFHWEKQDRSIPPETRAKLVKSMRQVFLEDLKIGTHELRFPRGGAERKAYVPVLLSGKMPLLQKNVLTFRLDYGTHLLLDWKVGRYGPMQTGQPGCDVYCLNWELPLPPEPEEPVPGTVVTGQMQPSSRPSEMDRGWRGSRNSDRRWRRS